MDYEDTEPLLLAQPDRKSNGKIIINKDNMNELLGQVPEHLPLSVISVAGPPSTGKFLLFDHLVKSLIGEDGVNPDRSFQWSRDAKFQETSGIWCYPSPFIIPIDGDRSIAVLLLYTQTSTTWDPENTDVCALMGLTLSLSSHTVFNVYKNLDEQCISAVGSYIKYAIQGQARPSVKSPSRNKGRLPSTPLQRATFLLRDWNFPSDFTFGVNGGKTFIQNEKLKEKQEHSKESRESRLLIKNLFENVSGCLLPFPGNGVIHEDFQGSIDDMDSKFASNFEKFVSYLVNFDESHVKRDCGGETVTGSKFREIMEDYCKTINDMERGVIDTQGIFRRYRINSIPNLGEQKEFIKVGLQAYADFWKRSAKNNGFLAEKTLLEIHNKAKIKANTAFENATCPKDEDDDDDQDNSDDDDEDDQKPKVDGRVKKMLADKMAKKFQEIKDGNEKKRKKFMDQCLVDSIKQYLEILEARFPEDEKAPSEKVFRRESKDTKATLASEFSEKIGASGDRDCMNDEQERAMEDLMDKLEEEEQKYYKNLFGKEFRNETNGDFGESKQRENLSSKLGRLSTAGSLDKKDVIATAKPKEQRSRRKKLSLHENESSSSEDDDDDKHKINVAGKMKKFFESSQKIDDEKKFTGARSRKSRSTYDDDDDGHTAPEEPTRFSRNYMRNAEDEKALRRDHAKVVEEFSRSNLLRR